MIFVASYIRNSLFGIIIWLSLWKWATFWLFFG